MAGLFVEFAISWLLLWLFYKEHPSVLGIIPTGKRLFQLFSGFIAAAACGLIYLGLKSVVENSQWRINENFTGITFWKTSRYHIISVLYEEFIFRGALLYIAIRKIGVIKASLLSAAAFGIYHWFSYQVTNPVQMIFVFISTGVWGYMFATAFTRTGSMFLPIGLHLGWNLIMALTSKAFTGIQFLVNYGGTPAHGFTSWMLYFTQLLLLPLFMWMCLNGNPAKRLSG